MRRKLSPEARPYWTALRAELRDQVGWTRRRELRLARQELAEADADGRIGLLPEPAVWARAVRFNRDLVEHPLVRRYRRIPGLIRFLILVLVPLALVASWAWTYQPVTVRSSETRTFVNHRNPIIEPEGAVLFRHLDGAKGGYLALSLQFDRLPVLVSAEEVRLPELARHRIDLLAGVVDTDARTGKLLLRVRPCTGSPRLVRYVEVKTTLVRLVTRWHRIPLDRPFVLNCKPAA
jgi:hypothetical protein